MEIEVVRDSISFFALRDEWEWIVAASPVTIFQTFDWQWLWWKYFGDGLRLHILLFRYQNKLIGIAPLCLEVHHYFPLKPYHRLRWMGGGVKDFRSQWNLAEYGPSDYLDIIALPGFEARVGNSFLTYVLETKWLDEVDLDNIHENGVLMNAVIPELRRSNYPFRLLQDHICQRITVPASLEQYFRGLRASVRHRLYQAQRAYMNGGIYTIQSVQSEAELRASLEDLVRLHQLRWNRLGYPGMFADKRFERFLREVAKRFLDRGWLCFKTARVNEQCVAARLGFKFKDTINDFVAGLDEKAPAAKRRPGLALLLSMIEDAIQSKMRAVNLVRGFETYKYELASVTSNNWKLVISNLRSRRSIHVFLYRVLDYLKFLLRKSYFEWVMFRVHYREHGFPLFLFRYVSFRTKKLSEKIANILKGTRSSFLSQL